MTSTLHDPIEKLRGTLEERFRRHTDRLAELTVPRREPYRGGYDDDTLVGLIAASRRGVADTAQALRRMADGVYGTCEYCAADIPLEVYDHVVKSAGNDRTHLPDADR